jgi:hypothetical protein
VPIIIGHNGIVITEYSESGLSPQEAKQIYLVHLQVGKMAVTVYTSKDYAAENVDETEVEAAIPDDTNSDELNDSGDEFSVP